MENTKNTEIRVINNFLKGFEKIISKDDLRPILCGVYFEDGYAIATDSHKLIKINLYLYLYTDPDKIAPKKQDINVLDGYFLDIEILKEIKITKDKFITLTSGAINIHRSNGKVLKTLQLQKITEVGTYPKIEGLVNDTPTEKSYFNFNGQFLTDIQSVYSYTLGSSLGYGLNMFCGPQNRINIVDENKEFKGIVMALQNNY